MTQMVTVIELRHFLAEQRRQTMATVSLLKGGS
jgi:hypothetical protein